MRHTTRIPRIRRTVVDASGQPANVPDIVIDLPKGTRPLSSAHWDREESIRRFNWYLARDNRSGLLAAYDALSRHACLSDALRRSLRGRTPNLTKMKALLCLWNERGLWSLPRSLGNDLPLFADAVKHFAPPYGGEALTLYRGQSLSRYQNGVIGIAWTAKLSVAEQFACFRDTPGVVLELHATPDLVIAHLPDFIQTPKTDPKSEADYEAEYLVDPRLALAGVVRKQVT